jgi:hypothetical protein
MRYRCSRTAACILACILPHTASHSSFLWRDEENEKGGPGGWLGGACAILQAGVPVHPHEHASKQLDDLDMEARDASHQWAPPQVMHCTRRLLILHPKPWNNLPVDGPTPVLCHITNSRYAYLYSNPETVLSGLLQSARNRSPASGYLTPTLTCCMACSAC